jgi:hypothetical protein
MPTDQSLYSLYIKNLPLVYRLLAEKPNYRFAQGVETNNTKLEAVKEDDDSLLSYFLSENENPSLMLAKFLGKKQAYVHLSCQSAAQLAIYINLFYALREKFGEKTGNDYFNCLFKGRLVFRDYSLDCGCSFVGEILSLPATTAKPSPLLFFLEPKTTEFHKKPGSICNFYNDPRYMAKHYPLGSSRFYATTCFPSEEGELTYAIFRAESPHRFTEKELVALAVKDFNKTPASTEGQSTGNLYKVLQEGPQADPSLAKAKTTKENIQGFDPCMVYGPNEDIFLFMEEHPEVAIQFLGEWLDAETSERSIYLEAAKLEGTEFQLHWDEWLQIYNLGTGISAEQCGKSFTYKEAALNNKEAANQYISTGEFGKAKKSLMLSLVYLGMCMYFGFNVNDRNYLVRAEVSIMFAEMYTKMPEPSKGGALKHLFAARFQLLSLEPSKVKELELGKLNKAIEALLSPNSEVLDRESQGSSCDVAGSLLKERLVI